MAKTSVKQRNLQRIKTVKAFEKKRKMYKAKAKDESLSPEERLEWQQKLQSLPRNSSRIRVRRRCRITGRGRSVSRKFGLSRIKLREYAMLGQIPGLVKSSW